MRSFSNYKEGLDLGPEYLQYPAQVIWPLESNESTFSLLLGNWVNSIYSTPETPCGKYMGIAKDLSSSSFIRFGYAKLDTRDLVKTPLITDKNPPSPRITASMNVKEAQVCSLNPCVKRISVSVDNGVTNFQELQSSYGYFSPNASSSYLGFNCTGSGPSLEDPFCNSPTHWSTKKCSNFNGSTPDTFWTLELGWDNGGVPTDGSVLTWNGSLPVPNNISFVVSSTALQGIWQELFQAIPDSYQDGVTSVDKSYFFNGTADGSMIIPRRPESEWGSAAPQMSQAFQYTIEQGGLSWIMGRVVDSLTSLLHDQANDVVTGQSIKPEAYVTVQWRWLSPLITIIVFAIIFLATTMISNHRRRHFLRKSSLLPFMYYGVERCDLITDMDKGGGGLGTATSMENLAKDTSVVLNRSQADEVRLVRVA